MKRARFPLWFVLAVGATVAVHLLASATTTLTIDLMGNLTEFAVRSRRLELALLPYWRLTAYAFTTAVLVLYAWPVVDYFLRGLPRPAPVIVERRALSFPVVIAVAGMIPWLLSTAFFPIATVAAYGTWSTELMSQQILSPLTNGFLAATASYLIVDWITRRLVIPEVFPGGRVADVTGAVTFGVRGRLLIFLAAVAFIPMFTMLGLSRAAEVRFQGGMPAAEVLDGLAFGSTTLFVVFALVGVILTLILARTMTRPLSDVAGALRRVQRGDLSVRAAVDSGDEVGVLGDGVNEMVAALREKERILQAFGRVVEPVVRDRLLAGGIDMRGELRTASVMFCDLRGFTSLAEAQPPAEVVATLNEFFTSVTLWVRECGGFVDKFIGDALLVVFGLFDDGDHDHGVAGAVAALRCALGIRDRLQAVNHDRERRGRRPLAVTIGLHTGEVLAGTIGAHDRHEYTVIGDTVNVAARLQQLCKERGGDLVVSAATYGVAEATKLEMVVTHRDSVALRGRTEPVPVYFLG